MCVHHQSSDRRRIAGLPQHSYSLSVAAGLRPLRAGISESPTYIAAKKKSNRHEFGRRAGGRAGEWRGTALALEVTARADKGEGRGVNPKQKGKAALEEGSQKGELAAASAELLPFPFIAERVRGSLFLSPLKVRPWARRALT